MATLLEKGDPGGVRLSPRHHRPRAPSTQKVHQEHQSYQVRTVGNALQRSVSTPKPSKPFNDSEDVQDPIYGPQAHLLCHSTFLVKSRAREFNPAPPLKKLRTGATSHSNSSFSFEFQLKKGSFFTIDAMHHTTPSIHHPRSSKHVYVLRTSGSHNQVFCAHRSPTVSF